MKKYLLTLTILIAVSPLISKGAELVVSRVSLQSALEEIDRMPAEMCRGALFLNRKFYLATVKMSEPERHAYFEEFRQQVVEAGFPVPRPPPRPGAAIDLALIRHCDSNSSVK